MPGKLLEILIPTLNREKNLIENIDSIQNYIIKNNFIDKIGILISDNGSTEASFREVEVYMKEKCTVNYQIYRQNENIGIEKNSLFLLGKSTAKYVMFLGDDDYFTENFLVLAMNYLESGAVTGIIPNFYQVDEHRNKISQCRDEIKEDKFYDRDSLWICMKGHQLSCLIFSRCGVYEDYVRDVRPNVYPFIYFAAHSLMKGKMVHITREPFENTFIPKKNFDYSFDNLMGEISIVFDCIPYADKKEKVRTVRYMIGSVSGRYCNIETLRNPVKMIKRIKNYNVSNLTKRILYEVWGIYVLKSLLHYMKKRLLS